MEEQTPPVELEWPVWMKDQGVECSDPRTSAFAVPEDAVERVDEPLERRRAVKESRSRRRGLDAGAGPVEKREAMGNESVDDQLRAAAACHQLEAEVGVDEGLELEVPDAGQRLRLPAGGVEVVEDGVQEVEEKEVLPLPHLRQMSMRV